MYKVQLQQFEGPMDLLLFFIKRDEIDIYDIPIAKIADEYLAYVRLLEKIDLDGVADFIYMAALLINIKARMLLPSENDGEEGDEVDPRRELVERLMEYVRFKEAADQLSTRREKRTDQFTRGDAASEREDVEERHEVDIDASIYDLVEALGKMLQVDPETPDPTHEVEPLRYTVEEQQEYVLETLMSADRVSFRRLIAKRSKPFIIATFLAVLELARQQYIDVEVNKDATDFAVSAQDASKEREEPLRDAASTAAPASTNGQAPSPNGEGE